MGRRFLLEQDWPGIRKGPHHGDLSNGHNATYLPTYRSLNGVAKGSDASMRGEHMFDIWTRIKIWKLAWNVPW
jgi:hypothetical protein